jgi:photosystem II stability/assembly factor-like uncharacterized protein
MFRKVFCVFSIIILFLLSGCGDDNTAVIPNGPPALNYGRYIETYDGGATWSAVEDFVPGANSLMCGALPETVFPPAGANIWIMGGGNGGNEGIIWRSTDTGHNWTEVLGRGGESVFEDMITVNRFDSVIAAVNRSGEVWLSNNWGVNWSQSANTTGPLFNIDRFHPLRIMIAVGSGNLGTGDLGKIIRSTDGGVSWYEFPRMSSEIRALCCIEGTNIAVAVDHNGLVMRSINYGETWDTTQVLTDAGHFAVAFAGTYGLICGPDKQFRSTDLGVSWTEELSVGNSKNDLVINDNGYCILTTFGSMFVSNNRGLTWNSVPGGIFNRIITRGSYSQNAPGFVFAIGN